MIDLRDYDRTDTCYRAIGPHSATTLVGAGFLSKKNMKGDDWAGGTFKHFSAALVLRGTGCYVSNDGVEIPLGPGSLFFRIPGVPHANRIDPGSNWLEFFIALRLETDTPDKAGMEGLDALGEMATGIMMLNPEKPVHELALDYSVIEQCARYLTQLRDATRLDTVAMDGLRLMIDLLSINPRGVQADPLIDEACAVLLENACNRTPLPELCSRFPISYVRLRQRFVERMGKSMGRYQLECRMDRATLLLRQGQSVKGVAYKLGYSDPFAFSKQFRQLIGVPPSVVSTMGHLSD